MEELLGCIKNKANKNIVPQRQKNKMKCFVCAETVNPPKSKSKDVFVEKQLVADEKEHITLCCRSETFEEGVIKKGFWGVMSHIFYCPFTPD